MGRVFGAGAWTSRRGVSMRSIFAIAMFVLSTNGGLRAHLSRTQRSFGHVGRALPRRARWSADGPASSKTSYDAISHRRRVPHAGRVSFMQEAARVSRRALGAIIRRCKCLGFAWRKSGYADEKSNHSGTRACHATSLNLAVATSSPEVVDAIVGSAGDRLESFGEHNWETADYSRRRPSSPRRGPGSWICLIPDRRPWAKPTISHWAGR